MAQEKHLFLRRRHLIVAVVLTQIRFLILQPTYGLFIHVSALDVDDSDCFPIQIKGTYIYPDRRTETIPRLASCALQKAVDVVDADDVDTIPLRHAHQDHSPFGHVREGTHRRPHLC